jgi:ligand-binding sensor domain-containing protein
VVRQGTILKYNANGDLQTKFKGSDSFDDVTVTPDNGLVAFSYLNRDDLVKLNAQGNVVSRIKGAISTQTDNSELEIRVAVDGVGNIYGLGTFSNGVFKFTRDGKYVSKFGEAGHDPGQFSAVDAIAVDNQGRVYVSDSQGIQVFSSEGRYLGVIKVPNYVAFGLSFNAKNELLVASRDQIYKFVVNNR